MSQADSENTTIAITLYLNRDRLTGRDRFVFGIGLLPMIAVMLAAMLATAKKKGRVSENPAAELEKPGPALFEVFLDVAQDFEPRLRSRILPDGKIQTPNHSEKAARALPWR